MTTETTLPNPVLPATAAKNIRPGLAKAVALFCALGAAAYAIAQVTPSPPAALFFRFAPSMSVILWLESDTRRTGVAEVHDLGLLIWFTSVVFIPWYAWKTRGRSGWRFAILLFVLMSAADVGEALGLLFVDASP